MTKSEEIGGADPEATAPDRDLVRTYLSSRDEGAFRSIYRRHGEALYRLALGLTGDPELAADVVQETWLRAMRGLDTFRWSSSLRTWLCGIAVNCCRESWRTETPASLPSDLPSVEPREGRLDLLRAVRHLPDRARAVVVLHEIFGHTHAEIGRLLDIEEGTSKSQLHYSRKLLRRWFEERDPRKGEHHVRG